MSSKTKKFFYYVSVVVPVFDIITGFIKGCLNIVTNPELVQQIKDQEQALRQLKNEIKSFKRDQMND